MRDVIQKMLEAEAEAKRIVAEAEAEAERLRADARRQAQTIAAEVHEQARAEAAGIVGQAAREADKEKQARLAQAAAAVQTELAMDDAFRAGAVEAVVRCVRGSA